MSGYLRTGQTGCYDYLGKPIPCRGSGQDGELRGGMRQGYWSSTTSFFEPDWAWALYAENGGTGVGQKGGRHFHVWAARDRFG
jgi:hypothetical protein